MNSSEQPAITPLNTNIFTMYLHVTKIHMIVHSSTVVTLRCFNIQKKKYKTWANIFMKNNVKQIMSNFCWKTHVLSPTFLLPED